MNKRIEELKRQCTVKVHSHGAFGENEFHDMLDVDKFAEEIIQQCAHITWLNTDETTDAHEKILQYFGVQK